MVDNQLRFTRESRRDWEKLGGGASCAGRDGRGDSGGRSGSSGSGESSEVFFLGGVIIIFCQRDELLGLFISLAKCRLFLIHRHHHPNILKTLL